MGVEFLKVNSYLFKFLEDRLEIFKIFIYKDRYAIHIADPSSIWDACHMNFVIDLCLCLCGLVVEHRN